MSGHLDILGAFFTDPRWAIRRTVEETSYGLALLVLLVSILSLAVSGGYILGAGPHGMKVLTLLWTPMAFLGSLLKFFFLSAVFHFIATWMGGSGKGGILFALLCFAMLPFTLLMPVSLLLGVSPMVGGIFFLFFLVIFGMWCLTLVLIGLQELYRFSAGKALATVWFSLVAFSLVASLPWFGLILLLTMGSVV